MDRKVTAFHSRNKRTSRAIDVEALSTGDLLRLHERHFSRLDPRGRQRIVDTASANGWDRGWDMDGLAA